MIENKIKKIDWKNYFKTKLYIASFMFALVGWFILFVFVFGQFFEKELLALEGTINSPFVTWGLRVFIIALILIIIKGKKRIKTFFLNKSIRWGVYVIYIIGALGWLAFFLVLFCNYVL